MNEITIFVLLYILLFALHEFGHYITAKYFKIFDCWIFTPMGMGVKMKKGKMYEHLIVYSAGLLLTLILIPIGYFLLPTYPLFFILVMGIFMAPVQDYVGIFLVILLLQDKTISKDKLGELQIDWM